MQVATAVRGSPFREFSTESENVVPSENLSSS